MPDNTSTATATRRRNTEMGRVVSRSGNKTIVVQVSRRIQHGLYERYLSRRKNFHVHDEQNQCRVGDWVRIVESRPLSRQKRWRLQAIVARGSALAEPEQPTSSETAAQAS